MVSEDFEVKVNEIEFHSVENVDFFVDKLNLNRRSNRSLPSYGGWVFRM